ncbi:hypothetical protein MP228_004776 [Amoeboaphelidium protococcarum]|nr:hypothetical protein MP228_004776 [Amoeboaphelidium protococcarum]
MVSEKMPVKIAVIGGSGIYHVDHMELVDEVYPLTPWGYPSDKIKICNHSEGGFQIAFLSRHGKGHVYNPSEVPYRANIAALKSLGVEVIIAFSAVGSLKEHIKPMDFVLPSQLVDRTKGVRDHTFFDNGVVAHVGFGDPITQELSEMILQVAKQDGVMRPHSAEEQITIHQDCTLVVMEGPAFSTRAESNFYRSANGLNADVINMSSLPEAKLAREAEISYAVVCMATDYDCWRESEEAVSVEGVIKVMHHNSDNAKRLLAALLDTVESRMKANNGQLLAGTGRGAVIKGSMKHAVITSPHHRNADQVKKLDYILPGYY